MDLPIFVENIDHTIYKNADGIIVPSVTTILKFINKESLLYWSNSLGFKGKSVKKELEISAYIGSTVHSMIENYTTNGIYDINTIDRTGPVERILIKNAFKSFLQFYVKEKQNLKFIYTEKELSAKRFGGTLDVLAEYNNKLTIIDYKTNKSFYLTQALQLAGYDILLRNLKKIKVEQYMIISLDKKDGNIAKTKIIDDADEMKLYRKCFKELILSYYSYNLAEQRYWK